jgi:hypothetical protein
MVKKITTELVEAKVQTPALLEIGEAERALAAFFEVDLTVPVEVQMERVVADARRGLETAICMGLRLLAIKEQCEHGEFEGRIQACAVGRRDAFNCMNLARSFAAEGDQLRRDSLLEMGKSKALVLLAADPALREQIMESPELLRDALDASAREFADQLAELKASNEDLASQIVTAEAERDGALKRLNKRNQRDEDDEGVPVVMADIRAEMAALLKKAELAITSLYPIGVEAVGLSGHAEAGEWVKPTLRLGVAGLLAVRELIDGSLKSYVEAMGESAERLASNPDALAFLSVTEIKDVAEEYGRLTAVHGHEAALRQHEREQAKPKGKGRPAAPPKAPKA